MNFFKYQGAGNDFLIADNRDGHLKVSGGVLYEGERAVAISDICDRRYGVGADGLMLLDKSECHDFTMVYFNSDGSGGMMCGNGGRCVVAFAADLGIENFDFEAADGSHQAEILSSEGRAKTVRLKMKDVDGIKVYGDIFKGGLDGLNGCFLDTGTRHFVTFVNDVSKCDVVGVGRKIRHMDEFGPVGANVNFVEQDGLSLKVRTYEKGVEDETFACGTGIVASSLASYFRTLKNEGQAWTSGERVKFDIRAVRDNLAVDFLPEESTLGLSARDLWLTGPATYVAEIAL